VHGCRSFVRLHTYLFCHSVMCFVVICANNSACRNRCELFDDDLQNHSLSTISFSHFNNGQSYISLYFLSKWVGSYLVVIRPCGGLGRVRSRNLDPCPFLPK